jgi:hypothetical protein
MLNVDTMMGDTTAVVIIDNKKMSSNQRVNKQKRTLKESVKVDYFFLDSIIPRHLSAN